MIWCISEIWKQSPDRVPTGLQLEEGSLYGGWEEDGPGAWVLVGGAVFGQPVLSLGTTWAQRGGRGRGGAH